MVGGDGLWNGPLRMLWREGTPMVSEDCLHGGRERASERAREGGRERGRARRLWHVWWFEHECVNNRTAETAFLSIL